MQLKEILKKEFVQRNGISPSELNRIQRENKIIIPSDLIFLLLNTDGLKLKAGYEITLNKIEPIVEIADIFNIEWLIKERGYDLEDESIVSYTNDYLKIANTFSQDRVLIGINKENLNQIFLYCHDDDEIIKVCDSIFEFINEHLV